MFSVKTFDVCINCSRLTGVLADKSLIQVFFITKNHSILSNRPLKRMFYKDTKMYIKI